MSALDLAPPQTTFQLDSLQGRPSHGTHREPEQEDLAEFNDDVFQRQRLAAQGAVSEGTHLRGSSMSLAAWDQLPVVSSAASSQPVSNEAASQRETRRRLRFNPIRVSHVSVLFQS